MHTVIPQMWTGVDLLGNTIPEGRIQGSPLCPPCPLWFRLLRRTAEETERQKTV